MKNVLIMKARGFGMGAALAHIATTKLTAYNGNVPEEVKKAFDWTVEQVRQQIEDYAKMNPEFKCMCETELTYCGTNCKNHDRK